MFQAFRCPKPRHTRLAWLLAGFFLIGGIGNIFASETILADYARWGYPAGFQYLTGTLELLCAGLLLARPRLGAAVGGAVILGALGTVLWHAEWLHALPPALIFALLLWLLRLCDRASPLARD